MRFEYFLINKVNAKPIVFQIRCMSVELLSRGIGLFGALGHGNLKDVDNYQSVNLNGMTPIKTSAGWGHSSVLTKCGRALIFGRAFDFSSLLRLNFIREVSTPDIAITASSLTSYLSSNKHLGVYKHPTPLFEILNCGEIENTVDIISSAGLTIGLTKSGKVYAFGLNRWGQCGVSSPKSMHVYNLNYLALPPVSRIEVGLQHCVALTTSGKLYGWGKGDRGKLITNEDTKFPVPLKIKYPVKDISLGFNHTAILTPQGDVYVWGKGMSDTVKKSGLFVIYEDQFTPRLLKVPGGKRVVEICSGSFSLVAKCEDGSVWAIGIGEYDRNTIAEFIPVLGLDVDDHLIIDNSYFLKKGNQRVTLARKNGESYQIVIHNKEAYLKNNFDNIRQIKELVSSRSNGVLIDVSTGWKHDLIIVGSSINLE